MLKILKLNLEMNQSASIKIGTLHYKETRQIIITVDGYLQE